MKAVKIRGKGAATLNGGRPFLIIKTFGRLKIYSYICIEH
jgi:hypothetical protein